jgi:hypothetical protein
MWEIRDYSDYSKKRGYGKRMGHRDPEEEAYECGYEDGYRDAMKEAKSYYGERHDDEDSHEYSERRMRR